MSGLVIAVLGAESSGKTTLAQALAGRLAAETGLHCTWVPEHLRAWCEVRQRTPRQEEQAAIAQTQNQAVQSAAQTHELVVADTTSLMTAVYSHFVFGDDQLRTPAVAWHQAHVHHTLFTQADLPWQPDGLMRDGQAVQQPVQHTLRQWLLAATLPWSAVSGLGDARLESALDALAPWLRTLKSPKQGLFTRLQARNAEPTARLWRCELCDEPGCEHALRGV